MRTYKLLINLPNVLTLARILVIPLMVIFYYLPVWWGHLAAAIIFAIASITDWLDGYLARYLKQATTIGAFLDPVADKLMVAVSLILIVAEPTFQFITVSSAVVTVPSALMTIPAAIIVAREIIVSALRELMAELGKRKSVAVTTLGKLKTTIQMIALAVLLYCDSATHAGLVFIGFILLYIAAILTVWSMFIYLRAAWVEILSLNLQ